MSTAIVFETNKYYNLDREVMIIDGKEKEGLSGIPCKILKYLADNSPNLFGESEIREAIEWHWSDGSFGGSLAGHISTIRKNIEDIKVGKNYTYIVQKGGKYGCTKGISSINDEERTPYSKKLTNTYERFNSLWDDILHFNSFQTKYLFNYGYTERKTITDEVCSFISNKGAKTLFITGKLGSGKSSIMQHFYETYEGKKVIHICTSNRLNSSTYVKHFLFDIAYQITKIDSEYRDSLKELIWQNYLIHINENSIKTDNGFKKEIYNCLIEKSEIELCSILLELPFAAYDYFEEPIVVFIDALDELERKSTFLMKEILELLSCASENFKMIVSFRYDNDLLCLSGIKNSDTIDIDKLFNIEEMENFIRIRLALLNKQLLINDEFIHRFAELCDGNFKYAEIMCESFSNEERSEVSVDKMPRGLFSLYLYEFSKNFNYQEYQAKYKTALSVISFFNGRIEKNLLIAIMNWSSEDYLSFMSEMHSLLVENAEHITYCHKSIDDWLKLNGHQFSVNIDLDAKPVILRFLWSVYKKGDIYQQHYDFQKLLYELVMSIGTSEQRITINKDLRYLLELQQNSFYFADLNLSKSIADVIEKNQSYFGDSIDNMHSFIRSKISLFILEDRAENSAACYDLLQEAERFGSIVATKYPETVFDLKINKFWYLRRVGKTAEAEKQLEEIQEFLDTHDFPSKLDDCIYMLYFRGCLKYSEKQYEEAKSLFEKCISDAKLFYSNRDALLLLAYNMIGWCFYWLNDNENEVLYFEKSLQLRTRLYGSHNAYTAIANDSLARSLSHEKYNYTDEQLKKALNLAEEALSLNRKLYGEKSENSCRNYETIALIYSKMNDYERAYTKIMCALEYRTDRGTKTKIAATKKIVGDICLKMYKNANDKEKGVESKKAYEEAYSMIKDNDDILAQEIVCRLNILNAGSNLSSDTSM